MATAHRFPLLVQFESPPGSTEAGAIAEYVRARLNDDAAVPGLRVPTSFTPDDGSMQPPKPQLAAEGPPQKAKALVVTIKAIRTRRMPK